MSFLGVVLDLRLVMMEAAKSRMVLMSFSHLL